MEKIAVSALVLLLAIPTSSYAEKKTFEKEYTYQASEVDSKATCRVLALDQVKKLLLQEIGVYVHSKFTDKNSSDGKTQAQAKEEITTLTAGIVNAEIMDEKWDGQKYWMKARMIADPDEVALKIRELQKDNENRETEDDLNAKMAEQSREIDRLKAELSSAKSKPKEQAEKSRTAYVSAVNELSASELTKQGGEQLRSRNPKEALVAFGDAIRLNPRLGIAYNGRGHAYNQLEQFEMAIREFDKAVQINPRLGVAFLGRGHAHLMLAENDLAMNDFNHALEINPRLDRAYMQRGHLYMKLRRPRLAVEDFKSAARLGNRNAQELLTSRNIAW
jgi:tetratricopeptide (TPR) repeat protein